MSYLSVISLARAKNYLRIDLELTEDDAEIISMINASCRYIEKRTNHIFFAQDKTYKGNCQVKVYDFPINSIVTNPAPFVCYFSTYAVYPDVKKVVLNVGYGVNEVPEELIQGCLQMIKVWYYESEMQVNTTLIPMSVHEAIDIYRRFI
jgi:hypothetical protein